MSEALLVWGCLYLYFAGAGMAFSFMIDDPQTKNHAWSGLAIVSLLWPILFVVGMFWQDKKQPPSKDRGR